MKHIILLAFISCLFILSCGNKFNCNDNSVKDKVIVLNKEIILDILTKQEVKKILAGVVKITLIHGIKIIPLLFSNIDDFQKLFSL